MKIRVNESKVIEKLSTIQRLIIKPFTDRERDRNIYKVLERERKTRRQETETETETET